MKRELLISGVMVLGMVVAWGQEEGQERAAADTEPSLPPPVVERASEEPDPFGESWLGSSQPRKIAASRPDVIGQTVLVRIECYDVETPTVVALLDAWEVKGGGDILRGQVLDLSKTGEAEVVDVYAATVEAGTTHSFDTHREYIYPTEYEPPGDLALMEPTRRPAGAPWTELIERISKAAAPTAFETRNLGRSLQIEIQPVRVEDDVWDVSLVPESVELSKLLEWGVPGGEVKLPEIVTFRSNTVLRTQDRRWALVCVQTPFDESGETRKEVKRMVFLKVERAR